MRYIYEQNYSEVIHTFVSLTQVDGSKIYIDWLKVSAIQTGAGRMNIYCVGDTKPFVVKETYQEILKAAVLALKETSVIKGDGEDK